MKFRELLIGRNPIDSRSEFKRVVLTAYLSLICMAVALIYTAVDLLHDVYYAMPSYAVLFLMSVVSVFLFRSKNYRAGKVCLMITVNMVVFWAALNDPFETGTFMFFIPTGIGSFAILAFHDRVIGITLASFTTLLFLLAFFSDLQPVHYTRPEDDYITISFILNYFISLTISVLIVYFLMNLNRDSENELIKKEAIATQKNAELQKVNDELDRFVYSVSHDLRSPLSSILGLTNLARKTPDPVELDNILVMIQGRVAAQDHFISEIIDYSKNERAEISSETTLLHKLIDDIVNALKFNPNADKIKFENLVPEDILVKTDKVRLSVILNNLIGNAIKYHDLKKRSCFIQVVFSPSEHCIQVKDNGIGIDVEHQQKIFDMFYRGSDRSTGSGLGLFITKEAASKINATISVASAPGEGSTFSVYLPESARVKS
ncbi:MAG TPA: HAMP domain-containing sensor histidine kinase [Chryseosolibacter sp.]|nr:HAMP domain-containing sensor histidine kinase [Chryseosolibacter sp.]